jgi:hypothetical protein
MSPYLIIGIQEDKMLVLLMKVKSPILNKSKNYSRLIRKVIIDKNGHRRTVYVRLGLPMSTHGKDEKVEKEPRNLHEKKLPDAEKMEVREFLLGEPVCKVRSGVIKADQSGTAIENAKKWAKNHAQEIIRQDIGKVVFDAGGVKDSLSHKFGQRKLDAVQAIPSAIEHGKVVEISDDLDKKPIKNVILVAPIQIDNEKSFLCIRLVKNVGSDNRLHVHEVFNLDDIKNTAIPFQTPGTDLTARPQRGIAIYLKILRNILDVKCSRCLNEKDTQK